VSAIRQKLTDDNKLDLSNQEVMVTAGANQVGDSWSEVKTGLFL
jgi:aspartate/methionine/tyrosine aminotransferase